MASKPTALKIDALSLIVAHQLGDDELAEEVIQRRDPSELIRAVALVGSQLAGEGAIRKATIGYLDLIGDRIEEKTKAA